MIVRFMGRIVRYNFQDTEDASLHPFIGLLVRSLYIFNFIFVPKSINNDIFKNYSVRTKMELLSKSNRTSEIKCEYSKMIIDIVKDMFADEVTITDLNDALRHGF